MDEITSNINTIPNLESFLEPDSLPKELDKSLAEMGRVVEEVSPDIPPTEITTDQAVDIFSRDNYRLFGDKFSEYGKHIADMCHHLHDFRHPKLITLYGVSLKYLQIVNGLDQIIESLRKLVLMSDEDIKMELLEYKSKSTVSEKAIIYTDYEGMPCRLSNYSRDKVYRYRRTHIYCSVSNAELAQQIEYDIGIPKGTAENCLSDICHFFSFPGDQRWLSAQYIHEVDHYLKSTCLGKDQQLNIKYADSVPNTSQIYQYGIELNIIHPKRNASV